MEQMAHVLDGRGESGIVYPLLGRPHDALLPQSPGDNFKVAFCTYLGATFDASTTNLTYQIPAPPTSNSSKPLEVVLSFLSPITPTSTLRQSIPASYFTVHVSGGFDVEIYVDLNGQWVSGDRGSDVEWHFEQSLLPKGRGLKTWTVKRQRELLLSEIRDRAEWGTLHFSAPLDVHHECGTSGLLRNKFAATGGLQNHIDDDFRGIMDDEPVFAFSKSFHLGASSSSSTPRSDSIMFTIAHIQEPVVQFASARGLTFMRPLWASWFSSATKLLDFHYYDFHNAARLAGNYSTQLAHDAYESGSDQYVDIAALTARQVIGATSFSGTPDEPILWMKEISSNGNFQTIDVIFPAFPFFLYTNPRWLAYLLAPILEHTLSGQYPNKYALHDLGAHFPNATGHPDGRDEYMPVEECGNILIMGLAIVNSLIYDTEPAAGSMWSALGSNEFDDDPDTSAFSLNNLGEREGIDGLDDSWGGSTKGLKQAQKWLKKSYPLWKQWTGYLVEFSLEPEHQLSTDDFAGPLQLQTNLALKGIIGIKAMSGLAAALDIQADLKHFKNISETYVSKWVDFGLSRDKSHAKLSYDWYGSWTTLYNLYADTLLCFHLENTPLFPSSHPLSLTPSSPGDQKPITPSPPSPHKPSAPLPGFVPHYIYTLQSDWYHAVLQTYGLPLDSRHLYTKSDWEFFAAAVTSKSTRTEILTATAKWLNETTTDRPMTDLFDTEGTGGFLGATFMARPVVGGHFAFLTLGRACEGRAVEGLGFLEQERVVVAGAQGEGERKGSMGGVEEVIQEL
ncbi:uncharacterized protein KY384_000912 [Bacidia gigantensis]|uniref:uncharacterized protein n=1 Tax=Bacidia gigantensis TaxID=2732470 RepID=UPI001D057364|nr:uncharacterized protein KY384_000912 [Bacidia gigantensis]KAG8534069.1 hypothetical protein KY384_000912 [Bacidia gigantensis]